MLIKARLAGAQKGHGLLKKKADALQVRFRMILGKIIEVSDYPFADSLGDVTKQESVLIIYLKEIPIIYINLGQIR